LVSHKGFLLVDVDSVEINAFYLESAKILQDGAGHWCVRELSLSEPGSIKLLNAMLSLDTLGTKILARFSEQWPDLNSKILQMTIFHLLRVLPYCKQQDIAVYVVMRARQLLFRQSTSLFGAIHSN